MRIKPSYPFIFSLLAFFWGARAFAAACCGGGFATPSLIVGDDAAQFTASYAYTQVVDDVGTDSFWHRREARETAQTWKLEGARLLSDRWQAGLSVPLVKRTRAADGSAGLGDVAASLGYEYLPDWDYNPWRPRGVGYFQLTAPTGKSVDESDATYQLDSRGRGYWAAGLGTVLTKIYGSLDAFVSLDGHRSFAKNYANAQSEGRLSPGWGGNAGAGAGYSLGDLRLGASLTWTYEDPVEVSGTAASRGAPQRFATAAASLSYLFSRAWAATLSYADQTQFGSPLNTSLGRGATLFVQRRWER